MNLRAIAYSLFFFQVIFSTSSLAMGGNGWVETGNGGFVMNCPGKPGKLLDLHEGETQLNMKWEKLTDSKETISSRVNLLIDRLAKADPYRGAIYRRWFRNFFDETTFIEGQRLYPIPDVGFTYIPKDCHLELAVFQRKPDFRTRFRYTINYDIWIGLDTVNKAALIMHELIYREASNSVNAHGTSEYTRYFNAWLHSTDFLTGTPQKFIQRVQQLNLQQAHYKGFNLKLGAYSLLFKQWSKRDLNFYADGTLKQGSISSLNKEAVTWVKPIAKCFSPGMRFAEKEIEGTVNFSPAGDLEKIDLTFLPGQQCLFPYTYGRRNVAIKGDHYTFHRDGSVEIDGNTINLEIFAVHGIRMSVFFLNQPVKYALNSKRRLVSMRFERTICWSKEDSSVNFYAQSAGVEWPIEKINEQWLPACEYTVL